MNTAGELDRYAYRRMSHLREKLLRLTELRYEAYPLLMESMGVGENLDIGDSISRIVKCHLLSEVALDKLLELALEPNGEAVLSARLGYAQKLNIASRFVLAED